MSRRKTKIVLEREIKSLWNYLLLLSFLSICLIVVIFAQDYTYRNLPNLQTLDYEHCKEQYEYGGYIGELCCVNDPDTTLQNKCAFYYKRGEQIG